MRRSLAFDSFRLESIVGVEGFSLVGYWRDNITLIAWQGLEKASSVRNATVLHYGFIDIDELIEKQFNQALQEIVDRLVGEQRFLKIEEQATWIRNMTLCDLARRKCGLLIKAMEFLNSISSFWCFLEASKTRSQWIDPRIIGPWRREN